MKGLFVALPPFAPDYSGVCSVLFELGGIVVILDGGGCSGNFTGYDEPRWYGSSSAIFSSGLREIDAVVGDDQKLLLKIENAIRCLDRRFIALVGSPAPMVIGTDYEALARLLAQKTNLPVLTFDANGIDYFDQGASQAFLKIAQSFVNPAASSCDNGVNIIGATPLDIGNDLPVQQLRFLLSSIGCRIISSWCIGSRLDEIAYASNARLNIVVTHAGLAAARYMEQEYGIPYIAEFPVGVRSTAAFIEKVSSKLNLTRMPGLSYGEADQPAANKIESVLVVGEQLISNGIRNCLRMDFGIRNVVVSSFFQMDPSHREIEDVHCSEESDLVDLCRRKSFDVIVSDPLYQDLLSPSDFKYFIPFPHIAVSSRLHWDNDFSIVGQDGYRYFENHTSRMSQ